MGSDKTYQGLSIDRGSRHCKIVDEEGEVVFRTTNLRDAEGYLDLVEERDRLNKLLEARGIAPHRIYMLSVDEDYRGTALEQGEATREVVIVAKADDEAVVVRNLEDGKEEIVDLDELEPIEGGSYLQATDIKEETVHVVVRYKETDDEEGPAVSISALRNAEKAEDRVDEWSEMEEEPPSEYKSVLYQTDEGPDVMIFRADVSVEE